MTEIELEIPDRLVKEVTETLVNAGYFHIEDVSYLDSGIKTGKESDWQNISTAFANMEQQLMTLMKTLGVSEGHPPLKVIKMTTNPESLRPITEKMEQEVQLATAELLELQKKVEKLQSYKDTMLPFIDLDIQFDKIRNRRYIYSILGTIPTEKIVRFKTSMAKVPFALFELKQNKGRSVVLLFGMRRHRDYLHRAARSAYLTSIDLPDEYNGTPHEIIDVLEEKIGKLQEEMLKCQECISELRTTHAAKMQELLWHLRVSHSMTEAMTRYGKLSNSYLSVGWVPSDKLAKLEKQLHTISEEILINIKDDSHQSDADGAPILLQNKGIWGGFQTLVTTYGLPDYKELDPTIFMTFTFPLLFGAMFGDVGQGAFLALLGMLLMSRKVKALRGFSNLGSVVFICGLMAMLFGFLYGSVFGIEDWLPALWLHPKDNIMQIILLTFAGGAVFLMFGNVLSLINDFRKRHWSHLFFSGRGLAGLILYLSLLGIVINILMPTFPVSTKIMFTAAGIFSILIILSGFFEHLITGTRPLFEGGIFIYTIQSFFELFETLLGFLSNSLSYVRVGAFAVVHAGLSTVIFLLADMINPTRGIGYWSVVVLGNLFILGFEGMIVSIQTLRLEYYEFFSRFFSGGGKKYKPLQLIQSNQKGVQ